MPESTRTPVAAAPSGNPFASLAPAGRDAAAETKLFEVPRELIEMARAHASESLATGTTTPLAPRPDAALEATLRAYTERLSEKPARVPEDLAAAASAPAQGVEREPEPMPLTVRGVSRPPALGSKRALGAVERTPRAAATSAAGKSRAWLVYAALCVIGLASCAHVLLGS